MKDKCILVTGSSSGIGEAITTKLLDLGAKVIGIARDHKKSAIKNDNYITYTFDISDSVSYTHLTLPTTTSV